MFFKNLKVYQFSKVIDLTALVSAVSEKPFRAIGKQDVSSAGFMPPIPHGEMLHHTVGHCTMLCLKQQTRSIPSSALRDAVNDRVEQIEQEQDRKVFSKEKKALKDDIMMERLPHQLPSSRLTYAYIDAQAGLLVVDASSHKVAEEFTSFLRATTGSLPIIPLPLKSLPSYALTKWLQDTPAAGFEPQSSCVLKEQKNEGGVIRCKDQDLSSDEVLNHLESGKYVSELAVSWNNSLFCTLHEDMSIKQLKFSDMVQEKVDESDPQTVAEQFDAEFAVMTLELARFIEELIEAVGGITTQPVSFAKLEEVAA